MEDNQQVIEEVDAKHWVNLTLGQLIKHESNKRLETFIRKVDFKKPFLTMDGREVVLDKMSDDINELKKIYDKNVLRIKDLDKEQRYRRYKFRTTEGKIIQLSDLAKTSEFEGRGIDIAAKELGICIIYDLICSGVDVLAEDFEIPENYRLGKHVSCESKYVSKVENIREDLSGSWRDTVIISAKIIEEKFGTDGVLHFRDELVQNIAKVFVKVNKNNGKPFGKLDKWNPADIWYTNKQMTELSPKVIKAATFKELNDGMKEYFDSEELIGISLKKFGREEPNIYNVRPKQFAFQKINNEAGEEVSNFKKLNSRINFTLVGANDREESGHLQFNIREDSGKFEIYCVMDGRGSKSGQSAGNMALELAGVDSPEQLDKTVRDYEKMVENDRKKVIEALKKVEQEKYQEQVDSLVEQYRTLIHKGLIENHLDEIEDNTKFVLSEFKLKAEKTGFKKYLSQIKDFSKMTVLSLARKLTIQNIIDNMTPKQILNSIAYARSQWKSESGEVESCVYKIIH